MCPVVPFRALTCLNVPYWEIMFSTCHNLAERLMKTGKQTESLNRSSLT
jgi:hypothetical protein